MRNLFDDCPLATSDAIDGQSIDTPAGSFDLDDHIGTVSNLFYVLF